MSVGFIIHDTISLATGVELSDAYAYIHTHQIILQKKVDGLYRMTGDCHIWKNQVAYTEGKDPIKSISFISDGITYEQLSSANPYQVAYAELKSGFNSTEDFIYPIV